MTTQAYYKDGIYQPGLDPRAASDPTLTDAEKSARGIAVTSPVAPNAPAPINLTPSAEQNKDALSGMGVTNPVVAYPRYGNTAYDNEAGKYYDGLDRTYTPEEENATRERIRLEMQSQIDAINASYNNLLTEEQQRGENRVGQTRAMNSRGGLLGSSFGASNALKTDQLNAQQERALEGERNMKLQEVFGKISERQREEVESKKKEAKENTESYLTYLAGNVDKSREDIKNLASGGVSLDKLNTEQYNKLLEASGFDKLGLEAFYNANKPPEAQIDYKYEINGNKMFAYGFDPVSQKLVTFTQDLPEGFNIGKSAEYTQSFAPDGTLILTPKAFDPTKPIKDQLIIGGKYADPKKVTGFFNPSEAEKSAAVRWLQSQPGVSPEDMKALETDQQFFYSVLQKSIDKGFYKPENDALLQLLNR